jgi:endonuclease YncB( thermonuclease family)
MILNRRVELKNVRSEKYGRMLADVYIGDINISDHLIKSKLAVSYDGGTKICPKNWMNYYLHGEFE